MKNIRLNIGGQRGNAFYILGTVHKLGKTMGLTQKECDTITEEMKGIVWHELGGKWSYEDLLKTFLKHFPFVELYAYRDIGIDSELYTIDKAGNYEL